MATDDEGKDLKEAERELGQAAGEVAKAEADLAKAEAELADARLDIAKAEQAIEDEKREHEARVEVLYNGVGKEFEIHPEELVKTLLDRAINKFGPIPNAHTLALFDAHGDELQDSLTLRASGVKPRDTLLLRPSKVKGG